MTSLCYKTALHPYKMRGSICNTHIKHQRTAIRNIMKTNWLETRVDTELYWHTRKELHMKKHVNLNGFLTEQNQCTQNINNPKHKGFCRFQLNQILGMLYQITWITWANHIYRNIDKLPSLQSSTFRKIPIQNMLTSYTTVRWPKGKNFLPQPQPFQVRN